MAEVEPNKPSNTTPNSETIQYDIPSTSLTWESSRILLIESSERKAWTVAGIAVCLVVLLSIAILLMLPLKENTPYLIKEDKKTGASNIVTIFNSKNIGYDEARDKYWLTQFITAYETYDWYTLQKEYDQTRLFASTNVATQYANLFEGDDALDKKYGNRYIISIEIRSISLNREGIATVRFKRNKKRTEDKNSEGEISYWVATVGYEYQGVSILTEEERNINYLGFQALTYRVDPEVGGQ